MKLQTCLSFILVLSLVLSACDTRKKACYAYGAGPGSGAASGYGPGPGQVRMEDGISHNWSAAATSTDSKKQGVLTGAELNDLGNWELWKDIDSSSLSMYKSTWKMQFTKRYSVLASTTGKCPVNNMVVKLIGNGKTIWESRTDNRGLAQLWLTEENSGPFKIECYEGSNLLKTIDSPKRFEDGINTVTIDREVKVEDQIDIVFAVDATSSMNDEIDFLKADLTSIISDVKSQFTDADLQLGSVFYQCEGTGNDYVTIESDLSSDIYKTTSFIAKKGATGGGEEVVDQALDKAINSLSWRENSRSKLLFILLDEPPASKPEIAERMAKVYKEAAAKGIRIVPCISSNSGYGSSRSLEFLMRNGAIATNSTLIFLTDDSGVGGTHTIPFTDNYTVELFKDVLLKVIKNYSEKPECSAKTNAVVTNVTDNNKKELVSEIIDSLVNTGNDSLVAASLLPFTGFSSTQELIKNKPISQVDTTALLNHFNESVLELTLYPNPTADVAKISITEACEYYELIDNNGRILLRENGNESREYPINLAHFPAGTYTIRCKVKNSVLSTKVQKI